MSDDYTKEDLHKDMEALRKLGLIEVVGVREDGQWLWGPTQSALNMTEEERAQAIYDSYQDGSLDD
jgi:hypothetical protein